MFPLPTKKQAQALWFVNDFMWRRVRLWERLDGAMELAVSAGCGGDGSGGEGMQPPAPGLAGMGGMEGPLVQLCCTSACSNLHLCMLQFAPLPAPIASFPCSTCIPLYSPPLQQMQWELGGTARGSEGRCSVPFWLLEQAKVEVRVVGPWVGCWERVFQLLGAGPGWWPLGALGVSKVHEVSWSRLLLTWLEGSAGRWGFASGGRLDRKLRYGELTAPIGCHLQTLPWWVVD